MNCQKRKASFEYVLLRLPYNFDIFRPNISHLYFEKYFNTIYILKNVKGSHHDSSSNMRIFTNSLKDYYKKKLKVIICWENFLKNPLNNFRIQKKPIHFMLSQNVVLMVFVSNTKNVNRQLHYPNMHFLFYLKIIGFAQFWFKGSYLNN